MKVNIDKVEEIIHEIAPAKLVAATKYVGIEEIEELEKYGVEYFGENRVQSFLKKYEVYKGKKEFHIIGTLQANKVKYIIDKVDLIHSVDSYSLLKEIEKQASKYNKIMPILLQVNIAKEESKHGFYKEEIDEVCKYVLQCPHIQVRGLMMMAPNIETKQTIPFFKETKELFDTLKEKYPMIPFKELSMGMSNDYQEAIKYGATLVRIGSLLFNEDNA